jgi:hypothetical protein
MPVWAWLFLVLLIAYYAFALWRAWHKKYVKCGIVIYSRESSPAFFWFFVAIFIGAEVFLLTGFVLVVASAIWGPIFHY